MRSFSLVEGSGVGGFKVEIKRYSGVCGVACGWRFKELTDSGVGV